jgi:hypothetical protein
MSSPWQDSIQVYFDENDDGYIDTRKTTLECENPARHLGLDRGMGVQRHSNEGVFCTAF